MVESTPSGGVALVATLEDLKAQPSPTTAVQWTAVAH